MNINTHFFVYDYQLRLLHPHEVKCCYQIAANLVRKLFILSYLSSVGLHLKFRHSGSFGTLQLDELAHSSFVKSFEICLKLLFV